MRTCKERGMETMKQFEVRFTIQESTEMSKKSYYDTIPRQKVITFQSTKPKKKLTMDEDETTSFAEFISCFDEKKLNLKFVMNFPVTSKPYAICGDDSETRSNPKSLFRNKLQSLCPIKPLSSAPIDISVSVVDPMRLVRMIPIKGCEPTTFLTWSKKVFLYIEKLPGTSIHIVFDNYAYYPDSFIPLSKGRKSDCAERNINKLNQVLPNLSERQQFLSNNKNKLSMCKLPAEFFVSGEEYTEKKNL